LHSTHAKLTINIATPFLFHSTDLLDDERRETAPDGDVTLVFTDIEKSTMLWESAPNSMDKALRLHDSVFREILQQYNG
jgi:class 3 adenylate cyclase